VKEPDKTPIIAEIENIKISKGPVINNILNETRRLIAANQENIIDGLRRVTKNPIRNDLDFSDLGRFLR
jgi:hypothetical protein